MIMITHEQKCKAIVLACGGHWHETVDEGVCRHDNHEMALCSCGESFYFLSGLKEHCHKSNPTFANPADLLAVIEHHPRCEEFKDPIGIDDEKHFYIRYDYVKEPDNLLNAAFEWVSM
jgi:hypothetical protein